MRQIIRMIRDVALEANKDDNERCQQLREVYPYYDQIVAWSTVDVPATTRIAEALVVGDFPNYFARTLSRRVYDRYKMRVGDWRDYCYMDQVPDYTAAERYQFSEFDRPVQTHEKMEPQAGYLYEETVRTLQVEDYKKQIDFSHRILVNDDLGAFNDVGNKLADSTRRFVDFYVSALYDNALTQAALGVLGANYAGTGALTTANLMIGWNAFVQRVDGRGNPIQVVPTYLVIPPILRLTANTILQSERIAELATNAINVMRGTLQVKEDPYIGFVAPNIPWYLFAAPSDIPAVTVVKLTSKPDDFYLWAKAPDKVPMSLTGALGTANWREGSFLTGDIEISVETTIGGRTDVPAVLVGVTDEQGIYYSSGTTP